MIILTIVLKAEVGTKKRIFFILDILQSNSSDFFLHNLEWPTAMQLVNAYTMDGNFDQNLCRVNLTKALYITQVSV